MRRLTLGGTGVMVFLLAVWVRNDPRANLETDWTAFDNAAERLFAGDIVYRPWSAETEPLPYLYPPFALWLALPLGVLGFYGSWLFSAVLTLTTFVAGTRLLARSVPGTADATTGLIVATASGTVVSAVLIGQYSGIYVLSFGLAVWLWTNDRQQLAGLALALLTMKPNLAVAVPVVLLWSRSWPALRGFAGGTVLALLASIPFGLSKWSGFVDNVQQIADLQQQDLLFEGKMVTITGAAQTALGLPSGATTASVAIWLVSSTIVGVATLAVWRPPSLAASPVRALSVLAAFMIVANPRMYFYDAALVVFGLLGIWLTIDDVVGGELSKRFIPAICAALWFFSWGGVFRDLNMFVGPLTAVVLVVVAIDAVKPPLSVANTPETAESALAEPGAIAA